MTGVFNQLLKKFRANINWYIRSFKKCSLEQVFLKLLNGRETISHHLYELQGLADIYSYYLVQRITEKRKIFG